MDRITESLLNEFSAEHDLGSLPEDQRFEHFASYITVRRQHGETFDTSDIVTGSGGDTGIDAIAIIVNGLLITDVEALEEHANRSGSLDVQFIFVQAERSASFESSKIGQFQFGVLDFFKDKPALVQNTAVREAAAIMSAIYKRSSKFKRGNPICRLFYVTTGRWQNDPALEARRRAAIADLDSTGLFREVEFLCIGTDAIQKLYSQTKNAISREFLFADRAVIPEISGVSEAYLGFIPAPIFLSIVSDEDGEIIKSIFYDNVRDWENYNPVNTEIRATLDSNHKARFVLMNNGVTIIAHTIRPTGNRFYIEDFQIVNGCQTSHVLADQRDKIDESVMIPLRLIGTRDDDVIRSIIHATNRQTEVKREQFLALIDFSKKLELFFQAYPNGKKLFYERRTHQYDSLSIEKTRIVTPGNLIRAFAAMFLAEPHATTRSYGALTDKVGKEIFAEEHRLEPYYVAAYTLYKLEYLFRNQRLAPEYKPARFHILLAARLLANPAPLPRTNSHEMERYCRAITDTLWDAAKADDLFTRAAKAVETVASGNFHRDNIRTQPFTEQVMQHCHAAATAA
jgi:AIPR protein